MVQFLDMLGTGRQQVNSGCIDRTVPQNIRKLYYVFICLIEDSGKKMPQIMGEHFSFFYPGITTQMFHLCPNLCPAQGPSRSCAKNRASRYVQFTRILQ